jgi:hypothetical protein
MKALLFCSLLALLLSVKAQDCEFVESEELSSPLTSFAFDDFNTTWSSSENRSIIISDWGGGVTLSDLGEHGECYIYNEDWGLASGEWDGSYPWYDNSSSPGYYLGINNEIGNCTITFPVDISSFTVRANIAYPGYPNATITAEDKDGNLLGCILLNGTFTTGLNDFFVYGLQTDTPKIRAITFSNAYLLADNLNVDITCKSGYQLDDDLLCAGKLLFCFSVFKFKILNSFFFIDVDECLAGTANCSTTATCKNTDGSFTCQCPSSYTGSGYGTNGCVAPPTSAPSNSPAAVSNSSTLSVGLLYFVVQFIATVFI